MTYSFCISWVEVVKRPGDDKPRREHFGRQLYYEHGPEARAERDWYAANPDRWAPSYRLEVEVSEVKEVRASHDGGAPPVRLSQPGSEAA